MMDISMLFHLEQPSQEDLFESSGHNNVATAISQVIKFITNEMSSLLKNHSNKYDESIKKVEQARDIALGNELTYTKKVNSRLRWSTVFFAVSLIIFSTAVDDAFSSVIQWVEWLNLAEDKQKSFEWVTLTPVLLMLIPLIPVLW